MPMRLDIHINADEYLELATLVPGKKYRMGLLYVQYDPKNQVFSYTVNNELFTKELEARSAQIEADAMRAGVDLTGKHSQIVTRLTQISLFAQVCKGYADAVEEMMKQLSAGYAGVTLDKISELLGVTPEELSRTMNHVADAMSKEEEEEEEDEKSSQTSSSSASIFAA